MSAMTTRQVLWQWPTGLHRLLGEICDLPGHGLGSCTEQAWDLMDDVIWYLDPSHGNREPWRTLIERDVAEAERRLRLYRANTPKRIAKEMQLHPNTISTINLGRHPIQARLATEGERWRPGHGRGAPGFT